MSHPECFVLRPPDDFNFMLTVTSHGWFDLPPFRYDPSTQTLEVAFHVKRLPVTATIRESRRDLALEVRPRRATAAAARIVASMLRLDEGFSDLHSAFDAEPSLRWAAARRAGRLLRCATAFEDAVKYLCTTNCSWALTRRMVSGLVEELGDPAPGGFRTFPRPEAMAAKPVSFYRERVRCGYRAPYLAEFACRVAGREVDPETWRESTANGLSSRDLRAEIVRLKGFGPYAAENLLKLCGSYDYLGIDSWCRATFARQHGLSRPATDARLRRHYARFGKWQGLAMWLDLTRSWHEPGAEPVWSGKGDANRAGT